MKRKTLALTLILVISFSAAGTLSFVNVGVADSVVYDWPMFRYDPEHSGCPDNIAAVECNLLWSFTTSKGLITNIVASSPAVVGGVVYIGNEGGYVYGLDAYTGACYWSFDAGMGVTSSPAVVDGVVYIGGGDKNVYALNASTGALIWNYYVGSAIGSGPAVACGVVYFGSWDGNVYAVGKPAIQPSPTPLPTPSPSPTPSAFPSPTPTPAPSPTPNPEEGQTLSPSPTTTPDELPQQKPTSTLGQQTPAPSSAILIVASVAPLVFAGSGFLFYFKKRKRQTK